jgi:hypothetical protein
LHVFYDHAKQRNPKYYLALIEKKLYRMLRISFGLAVEQKGEALVGVNTVLIPILFDIEKMMHDEATVRKFLGDKASQRLFSDGEGRCVTKISALGQMIIKMKQWQIGKGLVSKRSGKLE